MQKTGKDHFEDLHNIIGIQKSEFQLICTCIVRRGNSFETNRTKVETKVKKLTNGR